MRFYRQTPAEIAPGPRTPAGQTVWRCGDTLAAVRGAVCSDGKQRTAEATSYPDTFFSIPATVKVAGKNVSGFLTTGTASGFSVDAPDDPLEWEFRADSYGKNGHLLPNTYYWSR